MRWLACIISVTLIFITTKIMAVLEGDVFWPLILSVVVLAVSNVLYTLLLRRRWLIEYQRELQIGSDLVIFTIMLHYSGGIENPLFLIYLFHVIFSGILFDRRRCYAIVIAASSLFGTMAVLEMSHQIEHHTLTIFPHVINEKDTLHAAHHPLYVASVVSLQFVLMSLTAYFTTNIMNRLRAEERYARREGQLLRRVLQATGAGFAILDRQLQPVWLNPQIREWLNLPEMLTDRAREALSKWIGGPEAPAGRTLSDGQVRLVERHHIDLEGNNHFYQVTVAPLQDGENNIYQANYDIGGTGDANTEFNFPSEGNIFGAGSLGDDMSFFVEIEFGRLEEGTAETGLEGWLQFEDLLGSENTFNLRVGTLGMQEMGLFTARGHNRFSAAGYLYSTWNMPTPTAANINNVIAGITGTSNINYEGNPFIIHVQPGVELNGFGPRWRYALGVTNGNGEKLNDNNNEKDAYLQLAYKIGGLSFDGSESEDQDSLGARSDPWRDDSVTLSFFSYYGTSPISIARAADKYDMTQSDRFWRAGPGVLWRTGPWQWGAGYIWGRNQDPFGPLSNGAVNSQSWFVEASCFCKPWLIPNVRYETLNLTLPTEVTHGSMPSWANGADQSRIVAGVKALIRANVSLVLEGTFYTQDQRESQNDNQSQGVALLSIGL